MGGGLRVGALSYEMATRFSPLSSNYKSTILWPLAFQGEISRMGGRGSSTVAHQPPTVYPASAHQTHTSSLPSNMLVVLLASTALLSPLRNFAINQAQAAASTIVDTNQVISFNANPETLCETVECNPTRRALEIQKRKIIPPRARNRIAKVRLWSAKRLLSVTDRWARKRPPPQPSREEEETDQS